MSDRDGVLSRLVARIRALLPNSWREEPGERFRRTLKTVSDFVDENELRPGELAQQAVSLGRRKLQGAANEQYAAALNNFAEAEQKMIDAELRKKSFEAQLRTEEAKANQEEANARIARAKALDAEVDLFIKLKQIGVVAHVNREGNTIFLPTPGSCDLEILVRRRLQESSIESDVDKPFLMPIEDIFSISGRGTVVTGRIERGKVKVGEEVEIVGFRDTRKTVVTGVEMFKKQLDEGMAGDNAGLSLRGIAERDLERGMVLAKTDSIKPHTKFKAEVYMLNKEEGGRHTPFFRGYRPEFYFRTTDITGLVELPAGTELVMPGDNVSLTIELITPVAMEKGLRFAIHEGGRTVGAGAVAEILS